MDLLAAKFYPRNGSEIWINLGINITFGGAGDGGLQDYISPSSVSQNGHRQPVYWFPFSRLFILLPFQSRAFISAGYEAPSSNGIIEPRSAATKQLDGSESKTNAVRRGELGRLGL